MKITRKFIARKANVSPTTVSDVLNNNPKARIGQKARNAVIQAAKKYNYFPDTFGRSLVMKKTFNIGFINTVPITLLLSDPFNSSIFVGLESEIERKGYSLVFSLLKNDRDINFSVRKMILGNLVDGVILYRRVSPNLLNLMIQNRMKFVLIDNYYEEPKTNSILPDNAAGAYEAVRYLLEKGSRKITCVNGNEDHPSYRERPEGYSKAMEEKGLKSVIHSTPPDSRSTAALIEDLAAKKDLPDAFFATGDHMAIGILEGLRRNGIRVPEDVKLVGFDNIFLTEMENLQITTVNIPKIEMGESAVKLLLSSMESEKETRIIRLPTNLVIRRTA